MTSTLFQAQVRRLHFHFHRSLLFHYFRMHFVWCVCLLVALCVLSFPLPFSFLPADSILFDSMTLSPTTTTATTSEEYQQGAIACNATGRGRKRVGEGEWKKCSPNKASVHVAINNSGTYSAPARNEVRGGKIASRLRLAFTHFEAEGEAPE